MSEIVKYEEQNGGSLAIITSGGGPQLQDWCKVIATSSVVPDALRGKPADIFVTVMHGLDLGLKPMQAMNLVYVVKGRPSLSAEGMRARLFTLGHDFEVVELTDTACTVRGKRRGQDEWKSASFTYDQARKAKLSGANWDAYREDMLLARATTRLCKRYFPDATNGLPSYEEVLDMDQPAQPRPSLAEVAADRQTGEIQQQAPEPDDAAMAAEVLQIEQEAHGTPVDADVLDAEWMAGAQR